MEYSINILESTSTISNRILKALSKEVDQHFKKAYNKCRKEIVNTVVTAIKSHRTYKSLISGELKGEFGLDNATNRVNEILEFWKYLDLEYNKPVIRSQQIIGSFSLSMIKSDYSDVLSSAAAVVVTDKGVSLEWLRWLLLFGDKTIIKDYEVKLGPHPNSRSGNGIMIGKGGSRWSVPSGFAGVAKKNWITESIDSVESEITNLLQSALR